MPEMNARTIAKVISVLKDQPAPPYNIRKGYCRIRCEWGSYNMVNGSQQHIPEHEQVVGNEFEIVWGKGLGGYYGPMYVKKV